MTIRETSDETPVETSVETPDEMPVETPDEMPVEPPDGTPVDPEKRLATAPPAERAVWRSLRTVEDPELPVSVVDLGLIHRIRVEDGEADIDVTLTYSGCPARDMIVRDIETAVRDLPDIARVDVSIVYSPRWSYDRITVRGRRELREHGLAVPAVGNDAQVACEEP